MRFFTLPTLKRLLLICSFFAIVILFVRQASITFYDSLTYGGTDLRARTVGTRLLAKGYDPYFTKWKPSMGERLCDPNDTYNRPVNGVTITPFLLWLLQPLGKLDYSTIRIVWWFVQQALFIFITALYTILYKKSFAAVAAVIVCYALLLNHPFWFYHSERGQLYILYAAWLAVLFALWQRNNSIPIISTWIAIGVLMRPTLIVFMLPVLLSTSLKKSIFLVAGFCISIFIIVLLFNTSQHWQTYFDAMQVFTNMEFYGLTFTEKTPPLFPEVIEGTTNITFYKSPPHTPFLASLAYYNRLHHFQPPGITYLIIYLSLSAVLLLCLYIKTGFKLSNEQLLLSGTLLYVIAEVCQPSRGAYNLLMWVPTLFTAAAYSFSAFRTNGQIKALKKYL